MPSNSPASRSRVVSVRSSVEIKGAGSLCDGQEKIEADRRAMRGSPPEDLLKI